MDYGEEDLKVIDAMTAYGGSFVRALAECFFRADPLNFDKLKKAFPEYWEQYTAMARAKERKNGLENLQK